MSQNQYKQGSGPKNGLHIRLSKEPRNHGRNNCLGNRSFCRQFMPNPWNLCKSSCCVNHCNLPTAGGHWQKNVFVFCIALRCIAKPLIALNKLHSDGILIWKQMMCSWWCCGWRGRRPSSDNWAICRFAFCCKLRLCFQKKNKNKNKTKKVLYQNSCRLLFWAIRRSCWCWA